MARTKVSTLPAPSLETFTALLARELHIPLGPTDSMRRWLPALLWTWAHEWCNQRDEQDGLTPPPVPPLPSSNAGHRNRRASPVPVYISTIPPPRPPPVASGSGAPHMPRRRRREEGPGEARARAATAPPLAAGQLFGAAEQSHHTEPRRANPTLADSSTKARSRSIEERVALLMAAAEQPTVPDARQPRPTRPAHRSLSPIPALSTGLVSTSRVTYERTTDSTFQPQRGGETSVPARSTARRTSPAVDLPNPLPALPPLPQLAVPTIQVQPPTSPQLLLDNAEAASSPRAQSGDEEHPRETRSARERSSSLSSLSAHASDAEDADDNNDRSGADDQNDMPDAIVVGEGSRASRASTSKGQPAALSSDLPALPTHSLRSKRPSAPPASPPRASKRRKSLPLAERPNGSPVRADDSSPAFEPHPEPEQRGRRTSPRKGPLAGRASWVMPFQMPPPLGSG
ncbi:hypothetical protein JCM10450v2_000266 [Rhodotorula kratochvilovae]